MKILGILWKMMIFLTILSCFSGEVKGAKFRGVTFGDSLSHYPNMQVFRVKDSTFTIFVRKDEDLIYAESVVDSIHYNAVNGILTTVLIYYVDFGSYLKIGMELTMKYGKPWSVSGGGLFYDIWTGNYLQVMSEFDMDKNSGFLSIGLKGDDASLIVFKELVRLRVESRIKKSK